MNNLRLFNGFNNIKSCHILFTPNRKISVFCTRCLKFQLNKQYLNSIKAIKSTLIIETYSPVKFYSKANNLLKDQNYSYSDINFENKLVFNSIIKNRNFFDEKRNDKVKRQNLLKNPPKVNCMAIKYFPNKIIASNTNLNQQKVTECSDLVLNLPYNITKTSLIVEDNADNKKEEIITNNVDDCNYSIQNKSCAKNSVDNRYKNGTKLPLSSWMDDYEHYKGNINNDLDFEKQQKQNFNNFGSSNKRIPISKTPCGGCGAFLHCQDHGIPGFLPAEIFIGLQVNELRSIICHRCHFLKNYNTALSVNVNPNEYPKLLSKVKDKKALVILLVDITDFPCSLWPGVLDIIGFKRPLFILGNKVDLLRGDSKHWLKQAEESFKAAIPFNANVKYLSLISAKTGFGIEELINKLFKVWGSQGDVYLVGCTNVGKSTLFNVLLQSDYCKVKAVDLLQRATTSIWPGTTLNLLKFPILRPEGWRLLYRSKRLQAQQKLIHEEKKLLLQQKNNKEKSQAGLTHLIGQVGWTFKDELKQQNSKQDEFSVPNNEQLKLNKPGSGLNPNDKDFIDGRWFYDTPGTVQPDQIIDLLTIEELDKTLPKETILPRTFKIKPKQSLFIAGLGRLDYLSENSNIKLTVFASIKLPITVCYTIDADEIYNHYVGTKVLGVPLRDGNGLKSWPGLASGSEFVLRGNNQAESCADVVMSSAGWISVTLAPLEICKFLAWTPQARGIHIRIPPLLPFAVRQRGALISSTNAYKIK
uniref:G domain-containing protein n=1 Tax=Clastoptera arizonana TaxID=38151 RepID=A0A1B6D2K2_9HEMI